VIAVLLLFAELVHIQSVAPGVRLDIRYATTNNFTGQKVYDKAECRLVEPAARALAAVQRNWRSAASA
jgi:D-alanyl-D-alanine dipeptidase